MLSMNQLWTVLIFLIIQVVWGGPIIILLLEISDRVGYNRFKERPQDVHSEKAIVIDATISEYIDDDLEPNYRPNLAFRFVGDKLGRKLSISYTDELNFPSIALAYDYLKDIVPVGTPFTFLAWRKTPKEKPLFSGSIQEGDRLSPFLTNADHAFLKSVLWKDEHQPLIEVKHVIGDYSKHEFRYRKSRYGMIEGFVSSLVVAMLTATIVVGVFKSFPNDLGLTVIGFRKIVGIVVALTMAISSYLVLKAPIYSKSRTTFFEFEVNAQSIKSISP